MTSIHSESTTPASPFSAMAPAGEPAMSEWDLLAGMPQNQQKTPPADGAYHGGYERE